MCLYLHYLVSEMCFSIGTLINFMKNFPQRRIDVATFWASNRISVMDNLENYEESCSTLLFKYSWKSSELQQYLDYARIFQIKKDLSKWNHVYNNINSNKKITIDTSYKNTDECYQEINKILNNVFSSYNNI